MPKWRNWYTRTTQNRVSQGVRVQVSPPAQIEHSESCARGGVALMQSKRDTDLKGGG